MNTDMLLLPNMTSPQGISAGDAASMAAKSQGIDLEDPFGVGDATDEVMKQLETKGITFDREVVKGLVAEMRSQQGGGFVQKATDPVILPQPYVTPADFAAQYPQPLDPTEILTLCEEIGTWKALPEVVTDYQADMWREMTTLDFTGDGLTC